MKQYVHAAHSSRCVHANQEPHFNITTLTEQQIINLQDLFITPGIHTIYVDNMKTGREIMYNMLSSFKHYSAISCITQESLALKPQITDILLELFQLPALATIEDYVLYDFEPDFIWIETTASLTNQSLYQEFMNTIIDYGIPEKIAIIRLEEIQH